jgi:trimethylamine---corrinoid protein Co-methyltransferase
VQAGHEKTLTALMAALAGANLIYGAGMTESGVTFDYAQYVLDNDVARMVKHTVLGVPVNDGTLGIDDIHAVGSFGDYLSLDSTLRHMREQSQPRLMDRRVREDWEAAGARDAYAVAKEAARQILEEHHPEPLPGEVADQIDAVVKEAEERGREQ